MKNLSLILATALLFGCASKPSDNIIIDDKDINTVAYERDLNECAVYSEQVSTSDSALSQAGVGAVVGGVVGLIFGNTQSLVNGAAAGGVFGGASGGTEAQREKQRVVKNCLISRGYKVLN